MSIPPNGLVSDSTIADIHQVREQISDAFGGDIHAITEDAMHRQKQSGRRTVSFAVVPSVEPSEKSTVDTPDESNEPR